MAIACLLYTSFAVRALKARMYLYIGQLEKAHQEARYVIDAKVAGKPFMELSLIHI